MGTRGGGSGTLLPPWKRPTLDLSATGLTTLIVRAWEQLLVETFEVHGAGPTSRQFGLAVLATNI